MRYEPGTDPASAVETWKRQAKAANVARPSGKSKQPAPPRARDDAESQKRTDQKDQRRRRDDDEEEHTDVVPEELQQDGDPDAKATTARAVPGSQFRGRFGSPAPDDVLGAMHAAMQGVHGHVRGIVSIERAVAMPNAKPADKARAEATYVVTLDNGAPITIRIATGPLEGDLVARTIVNASKVGVSRVERAKTDGSVSAHNLPIEGRYVVQISDSISPNQVERAVAHEVAEILAERALSRAGHTAGRDALVPGVVAPDAQLSPHDMGRITEVNVVAGRAQKAPGAEDQRELLALVEHLGLREGTPGAMSAAG